MIDRWGEQPTGHEPSLEGDKAGGDDEELKDVLPKCVALPGRPDEGSRCPALISTQVLTARREASTEQSLREEANAKVISM